MTQPPHAPAPRRPRVLVVDACRDGAESCALLLRLYGHETRVARSCADALRAAPAFGPDVVLSELRLPDGSGYELAARLRRLLPRRMALVAHTGHAVNRAEAERSPFDLHLLKPVDPVSLVALLAGRATPG